MNNDIKRLGFDAWAGNIIVNAIEDGYCDGITSLSVERPEYTLCIENTDTHSNFSVRAYVENSGWHTYELTIKRPPVSQHKLI